MTTPSAGDPAEPREGQGEQEARARRYYDRFASSYEAHRDHHDPGGYHDLVDDLEVSLVERYARGGDVLEVGCGTGLLLRRFAAFAKRAEGVDLSPGMLERARARGLSVREASATSLPFDDATFDVTCAFKVLPHVPELAGALAEMARVTRPGGVVIAELYNPLSFRGLAKVLAPPGKTGAGQRESDVYTRLTPPWRAPGLAPPGTRFESARGIRIVTPAAVVLRLSPLRAALGPLERALCDGPLRVLGGFYAVVFRREGARG